MSLQMNVAGRYPKFRLAIWRSMSAVASVLGWGLLIFAWPAILTICLADWLEQRGDAVERRMRIDAT